MKVIFLDFDGVLNSAASFVMETRIRKDLPKGSLCPVNQTLSNVCCSNLQYILEAVPSAKIVISSAWRTMFELDWLKAKLASYGIDSTRVVDATPHSFSGPRGREIQQWLEAHPQVKEFVILDDNYIGGGFTEKEIVTTTWTVGLTLTHALQAIKILGEEGTGDDLPTP